MKWDNRLKALTAIAITVALVGCNGNGQGHPVTEAEEQLLQEKDTNTREYILQLKAWLDDAYLVIECLQNHHETPPVECPDGPGLTEPPPPPEPPEWP